MIIQKTCIDFRLGIYTFYQQLHLSYPIKRKHVAQKNENTDRLSKGSKICIVMAVTHKNSKQKPGSVKLVEHTFKISRHQIPQASGHDVPRGCWSGPGSPAIYHSVLTTLLYFWRRPCLPLKASENISLRYFLFPNIVFRVCDLLRRSKQLRVANIFLTIQIDIFRYLLKIA